METGKASVSKSIEVITGVTVVLCFIGGAVWGALYNVPSGSSFRLTVEVGFGLVIGAIIGLVASLPIYALLIGIARIVAWCEAVPPEAFTGLRAGVPAEPASSAHPASDVPVAHHEVSSHAPDVAAPSSHWKCPNCGSVQPDYVKDCRRCGAYKPANLTPAAPKPAPVKRNAHATTWQCTCGAENPVSRGTCDSCGGAKPFQRSRLKR